jgi:hypothetical protein
MMNNKQQNTNLTLFQFMLRAQQIAQQDPRSEKGYAMVVASIVSIVLFSLLAAYMTMTNLNKSSTNAYVDGTNTFYASESGLNRRAEQLRQKFLGYATPTGVTPGGTTSVSAANITSCFPISTTTVVSPTNDFECRNYPFKYHNSTATVRSTGSNDLGGGTVASNQSKEIDYTAYTFVADQTLYNGGTAPTPQIIPPGQDYAGLNALEYRYTVYSTAAKANPDNPGQPVQASDAKTVLQMDFKSRVVPLFQFAVFYDGDLEMNSSANMTIGGRTHTNGNFYVQPNSNNAAITTTFLGPITAVGSIYNRVDSTGFNAHDQSTRVLMTAPGTDCSVAANCLFLPNYSAANTSALTAAQLAVFGGRVRSGIYDAATKRLETPPPGFLRKRNYFQSSTNRNAGEYFAKADMRLEMVPDRDVTSTGVAPWTRNQAIIPFNFTSITSTVGTAGSCTTTLPPLDPSVTGIPTLASDPAANYIAADRNNASTLHCNVFSKGQLQSLRQPVLALTTINQPNAALQTTAANIPTATSEAGILGRTTILPAIPAGLSATASATITPGTPPNATQKAILRALQVALASTPSPIALDTLNLPFSNAAYTTAGTPGNIFLTEFTRLLNTIPVATLTAADRAILIANATTPNSIAAIGGAWFLPAPIQRIESNAPIDTAVRNLRSSGFYDGRERKWITMLQTNIASLSVWNRDGLYVEATTAATGTTTPDNNLRTAYQTNNDMKNAAFNAGAGANFTNGLAFDRAATIPATPKGLQSLGLGSIDNTEGGLVFHATVSDDLNGDGVMNTNDVSLDIANPIRKQNPDGTNFLDSSGNTVIIDYARKYRGSANFQSPFAFAFNGGNYLPAPLTLTTDQAIYIQGDFNNNGAAQTVALPIVLPDVNRLPASIIGDTITVLSNQCLSNNSAATPGNNDLAVPMGQIHCGLPRASTGSVDVSVWSYTVTGPTAVNAAFLSNTDRSIGNLPDVPVGAAGDRGYNSGANRFSGAINNYMRMLEDWGGPGGFFFNYSGSFVSLGTPLEYSGAYVGGGGGASYYNIPTRNFNFDANFNAFGSLPPLPPRAIYLQQDVFKRTY